MLLTLVLVVVLDRFEKSKATSSLLACLTASLNPSNSVETSSSAPQACRGNAIDPVQPLVQRLDDIFRVFLDSTNHVPERSAPTGLNLKVVWVALHGPNDGIETTGVFHRLFERIAVEPFGAIC